MTEKILSTPVERFEGDITIPRKLLAEAYRGLKRHYEMPEVRREIDRLMSETPQSEKREPTLEEQRYAWFRQQPVELKVSLVESAGDEGYLLDHFIDKGMCGL